MVQPSAKSRIERLFQPKTIAVIGGGSWCANVIEQCQKIGFAGDIWPVHPTRNQMAGVSAYPSIDALPHAPDAAFIGINRDATIDAVAHLAQRGAGGCVCFASGFSESQAETQDGADKQSALCKAAGDMPILGPNCYGFVNYLDGVALWPDQHGGQTVDRGVAIVTQSSNIAINLTMQDRGLPIAYMVTVGNQAQIGMHEAALSLIQDPRVTALGLHIEGVDSIQGLEQLAHQARALGKPVVALKVGASDQARAATISHTASLAGSDAGARALLKRLGIGQVRNLPAMLETLKLLHVAGPLASHDIASMSCSGGEASLVADMAMGHGLTFPALNAVQTQGLTHALGPHVALANPLDYHTYIWGDEDAMADTFTAMMQGNLAIGCIVLDFPRADRCDPTAWHPVIHAAARAKAASRKPIAIVSSLQETMPEDMAKDLIHQGIVPLCGLESGLEAIKTAADIGSFQRAPTPTLPAPAHGTLRTLTEADAKAALAAHGLRIPKGIRAHTPQEAAKVANDIGFPVVLKGEGLAHKTEAGAVALNLRTADAVLQAAQNMACKTYLIEEMITDTVAELLIGILADPAHGYVITIGAGGTLAELMTDQTSVLIPVTRNDLRTAIGQLKIARILNGYRGAQAADIEAVLDSILAVQAYVTAHLPAEVEINPLLCRQGGAIAADALIQTGDLS
ncbi:MAG: acetate--CoA ligase family protein [Planktomarina sp.]